MERDDARALSRGAEAALLLAVVAAAVLTRVLGYAGDLPRFWFAQTTTVWVAKTLEYGDLWRQWVPLLRLTQPVSVEQSAVMMPVAAAFQAALGPSLGLATVLGALWGVLAVVLAWRLGRALDSPAFGLVFAGLLAASPLAIAWARLGGVHVAAAAHILLVCWLGQRAGARGSVPLAILAGAVAWASLYHYFPTRVALPLVFVALLSGAASSRGGAVRALAVMSACAAAIVLAFVATRPEGVWSAIWPRFPGYVGNRGAQTPGQLLADVTGSLQRELPHALRVYFWTDRTTNEYPGSGAGPLGNALTASIAAGGLCLVPVALLGGVGLLAALRHPGRGALWLALAGLGLLVPCLSAVTARRFLVFDLAWCALAAEGLVALLRARRSGRGLAAAVGVALALGAYAFAVVTALDARLSPHHWTAIPFGESGFGDGRVCLACARHSRRWEDAIRAGAFVVLFDSDVDREGRTIPSGLPLYGKIAALAAGRPHGFVEYYSVAMDFDMDPPRPGPLYDAASIDLAAYLAAEIERVAPTEIRWAFPQPTQWERGVAERLQRAGGAFRAVDDPSLAPTPLHDPGFEVVTPWERRADAIAALRNLAGPPTPAPACVASELVGTEEDAVPALVLAPRSDAAAGDRRWVVGSYHVVRDAGRETAVDEAVRIVVDGRDGARQLDILTRGTGLVRWDPATAARQWLTPPPFRPPLGTDCAVRLADEWWSVDPILGRVARSGHKHWLPPGSRWVGIAGDPDGHLVVARADQTVHVFDVAARRELAAFAAHVPPSRRIHFGECSPLVAGDGWIATLDHLRHRLFVYGRGGGLLGALPLDGIPPMLTHQPTAVAADGSFLGVSTNYDGRVSTLRLGVVAGCPGTDLPRDPG